MYTKRCFMRTVTFHLHLHYTTSHLSTARTAIQTRRHCQETTAATIVLMNPTPPSSAVCTMYTVKAKFHYSSKLQTWLQTWLSTCVSVSKARWKQVESQLQTCLKPSDDHTCVTCRDWCSRFATKFSTKKSKACRKHVANPHEQWRTCQKPGCKPGRKPGLQLARIMECGFYCESKVNCGLV